MSEKYWMGSTPAICDTCDEPIKKEFTDGKTRMGPWANMCPGCSAIYGVGLGLGRGQKYEQQTNGRWLKTGG